MDEQTRYRVTGSLFLLALATICLPMLFDGAGLPPIEITPLDSQAPLPDVQALEDVAPASDVVERVEELRAEVDDEGFYTASGSRVGEPVLTTPNADTRAWAVQVASFKDLDNALKLRSDLRSQGFEAFISTAKTRRQVLSRVAIGPFLSESDADQLQQKLDDELALNTRLMAFSN